jgi:cytidyltransferase-like protein
VSAPKTAATVSEKRTNHMIQPTLADIRERHASQTLFLAHGVYDILHPGHIRHLEVARSLGDVVVAGLWSDDCTRYKKGPSRPFNPIANRLEVVRALRSVDYAFEIEGVGYPSECMLPVVNELQPDIYLISSTLHPLFGGVGTIEHPSGLSTALIYDITYALKSTSTTKILSLLEDAPART